MNSNTLLMVIFPYCIIKLEHHPLICGTRKSANSSIFPLVAASTKSRSDFLISLAIFQRYTEFLLRVPGFQNG